MLGQRIATAVLLAAGVLVVLFLLPAAATVVMLSLLMLVGAWEWAAFAGLERVAGRLAYTAGVGLMMLAGWWLAERHVGLQALLWAALVWWSIALLWIVFQPAKVTRRRAALAGMAALVPAWLALAMLYRNDGPQQLLFVLLVIWAADIGAFVVGRSIGRVKLAPRVSPAKTWEGVIGGVLASGLVGLGGAWWFELPVAPFLALCLGAALISVVGDLTESMFKRHVGIKDSGSALPGHGGILDRIDSVTAAAPLFVLGLEWLGG